MCVDEEFGHGKFDSFNSAHSIRLIRWEKGIRDQRQGGPMAVILSRSNRGRAEKYGILSVFFDSVRAFVRIVKS